MSNKNLHVFRFSLYYCMLEIDFMCAYIIFILLLYEHFYNIVRFQFKSNDLCNWNLCGEGCVR